MKKAGDRWPFQTMRNSRDKGKERGRGFLLCTYTYRYRQSEKMSKRERNCRHREDRERARVIKVTGEERTTFRGTFPSPFLSCARARL